MLKLPNDEKVESVPALDTRVPRYVRIINGALDESADSASGVVLNGRLDTATLHFLKVDGEYQRPLGDRADIFEALKNGTIVPNVDIGVRGQDFEVDGDDFLIKSPAYIIDGWQRVGTARKLLEMVPNHPIRIFATLHFGTDALWERHRFTELNKNVKKVSPNLHLRNMRDSNEAVLTLFGLSNNTRDFALYKRVSWSQNMARGELMPALQMAKVAMRLHSHQAAVSNASVEGVSASLSRVITNIGLQQFRKNVSTFFDVVDECWDIRTIEMRHAAPQIKATFLMTLARVFSAHVDFWAPGDKVFFVPVDTRRKLAKFPMQDPHVKNLCGAPGAAQNILYEMLCRHIDSGKRTGHLRARAVDSRGHIVKAAAQK